MKRFFTIYIEYSKYTFYIKAFNIVCLHIKINLIIFIYTILHILFVRFKYNK